MRWCVRDYGAEKDEELALLAQQGDGAAAEELLLRYRNAVRSRARKYFLEGGETEDLVQEGMIGLYSAIRGYNAASGKSFKNFAYLCVTRRIYDVLRIAGRHKMGDDVLCDPDSFSEGDTPEDFLIEGESRAEFRLKLMRALSDFEFRVVTMYLEGMSYAAIAEVTGKDMKSIDNALFRSKKKLQKAFSEETK